MSYRELLEETGLTAVLELDRVVEQAGADGAGVRFHVFTGRTDACQEDVVLGEGLAMLFLAPDEIATKELVSNVHMFLSRVSPAEVGTDREVEGRQRAASVARAARGDESIR